jgi:opacity protein-like surface antigen
MKRLPLFLSIFCLSAASILAQQQPIGTGGHFGIKGGICFANQKLTYPFQSPETKYRTGFDAGVYVESPIIGQRLACMIEIHYMQKGMMEETDITGQSGPEPIGTLRQIFEADYLSIPLLVKWRKPIGRITPYALVGPRVDFFLRKKAKNEFDPLSANPGMEADWQDLYDDVNFRKTDFGATAGLGVEAVLKGGFSVLLEIRYDHSFINAVDGQTFTIRNRSFQCLAGIRVPIRGIGVKVNAEKN